MVLKARNYKPDVEDFQFGSLSPGLIPDGKVSTFELNSLNNVSKFKNDITEGKIRNERKAERATSFTMDSVTRQSRGLNRQEDEDFEKAVAAELERRIKKIQDEAFQEGFQTGEVKGYEKSYQETKEIYSEKIIEFTNWLDETKQLRDAILSDSKTSAFEMIKNLVKWVTLKEVDDKEYLERLLEKLILEMNTKSNLLIKVNEGAFKNMDEILEQVQNRLGNLTNVRVEKHLDLDMPGIVLECENGIVDGSLDAQFLSLDRLFESVARTHES